MSSNAAFAILAVAHLTAALQGPREPSPKLPEPLGAAPPFSLPSLRELKLVTNADFAGKVVFVTIGRSASPAYQRDASYFVELREKFAPRGFEILAVADENRDPRTDPVERALQFAAQHKWDFPLVLNDGGEFHEGYYRRLRGTPSGYLIHRNGDLEFLGQDPARAEYRADLEALIERRLGEPAPEGPPPPPRPVPLPGFTLLSWKGGVIRDADLHGKPAILALLSVSMLPRFSATLSSLSVKYTPLGLRVVVVVFGSHREIWEELQVRPPSFEVASTDAESQNALVGQGYIPRILFVSSDARIVKTITAIYGAREGIEGAVFERYAALLVGEGGTAAKVPEGKGELERRAYRNAELGYGIDPPGGFKPDPTSTGSRARFLGPSSQELSVAFETRFGATAEALEKAIAAVGSGLEAHQILSRQDVPGGGAGILLDESWASALGTIRAIRLLVPHGTGIYVVTASSPEGDFSKAESRFRTALESFVPGRP